MSISRNIIAIGRSALLYNAINYLHQQGFVIRAIITDYAYDEYAVKHNDFKVFAEKVGAAFFLGKMIDVEAVNMLVKKHDVRIAISANWKYTLPVSLIHSFTFGILNLHLGNLPDYKGNATVNWSILQGEQFIYANIHKMAEQLDAGDIIVREAIPIHANTYVSDVINYAEALAPKLYYKAIDALFSNPNHVEQKGSLDGLRCYPRLPEDGLIDWNLPAEKVHRLIRASSYPFTGAFSYFKNMKAVIWKASVLPYENYLAVPGHIVRIEKKIGRVVVATGDGLLAIEEMQIGDTTDIPVHWCSSIRERFHNRINDSYAT